MKSRGTEFDAIVKKGMFSFLNNLFFLYYNL